MAECIKCGKEKTYTFHTIEVHTLPVRDYHGEKKVQALGNKKDFFVCSSCANEEYKKVFNPAASLILPSIPCVILLLAGIGLSLYFWNRSFVPFKMLGLAAIICGITVIYSKFQRNLQLRNELSSVEKDEAIEKAGWLCVIENVPKKYEDNDLSYIPINKRTLALKNGDLMVLYNLLPQIAIQAYNLMHDIKKEIPEENKDTE